MGLGEPFAVGAYFRGDGGRAMSDEWRITVRSARAEDAAGIARTYVESWRSAYAGILPDPVLVRLSPDRQARQWRQAITRPRHGEFTVVAEAAGTGVVGFGSGGPARAMLPYLGEVYTLYLMPDWQGYGLGRRLMQALFAGLARRGLGSALIWVLEANPSRFFYEAMGGTRAGERTERLWGTDLPELAYGWDDVTVLAPTGDI